MLTGMVAIAPKIKVRITSPFGSGRFLFPLYISQSHNRPGARPRTGISRNCIK